MNFLCSQSVSISSWLVFNCILKKPTCSHEDNLDLFSGKTGPFISRCQFIKGLVGKYGVQFRLKERLLTCSSLLSSLKMFNLMIRFKIVSSPALSKVLVVDGSRFPATESILKGPKRLFLDSVVGFLTLGFVVVESLKTFDVANFFWRQKSGKG